MENCSFNLKKKNGQQKIEEKPIKKTLKYLIVIRKRKKK
jgi:hypothetical protein